MLTVDQCQWLKENGMNLSSLRIGCHVYDLSKARHGSRFVFTDSYKQSFMKDYLVIPTTDDLIEFAIEKARKVIVEITYLNLVYNEPSGNWGAFISGFSKAFNPDNQYDPDRKCRGFVDAYTTDDKHTALFNLIKKIVEAGDGE